MKSRLFFMLLGLAAVPAFGATLFGETVQVAHEIDSLPAGSIDQYRCGPTNVVVGAGVEVPSCDGFVDIDLSGGNILLDFLITATPTSPLPFNGLHFFDINGTIADIIGVTVNGATTIAGVSSRVSFDADNIRFDMAGMPALSTSIVSLDVELAPEPSTLLLLGTGFTALFLVRRRIARS